MLSKSSLKKKIKNLKFFTQNLQPNSSVSLIKETDTKKQEWFFKELIMVNKLVTAQLYLTFCKDTYGVLDNPKQYPTKVQFKKNITNQKVLEKICGYEEAMERKLSMDESQGIIKMGDWTLQAMPELEFDMYVQIFKELSQ
jgi:hypothetical protein